jgi:nuclear transcription factor Y, gamma
MSDDAIESTSPCSPSPAHAYETLAMEPKSNTPPPPHPLMGVPIMYPSAAVQQQPHQQGTTMQQQLQMFWAEQYREIEATTDFKNHNLPLAHIKKIMKADEDVHMIVAEASVIFAHACEMLILEVTRHGWAHTEESKCRTLHKSDIAGAVACTEVFDFLIDIVTRDKAKDVKAAIGAGIPHPAAGMPATNPMVLGM